MQKFTVKHIDAFSTKPFCGNPAGIITEADGLTRETMQWIASEMNLSESAFVTLPESEDTIFRIRFFTPSEEVDLSGHVTIATCFALLEEGRIPLHNGITKVAFGTNFGSIPVDIHFNTGPVSKDKSDAGESGIFLSIEDVAEGILEKIMMHQSIREYRTASLPIREIANILGIDEGEISRTGLPLEIITTGLEQLMIPVLHKETILEMNPDLIKLSLMNNRLGIHTNHIFTLDTFSQDCSTYSRHFAPSVGMWEDPATGTAAAGLGTYLCRHGVISSGSLVMEQGKETESLAKILVELGENVEETGAVQVGGLAVTSITRTIEIESGLFTIA